MPVNPEHHQFRSPLFQSVVKQALDFFFNTPVHPLPPDTLFRGVGVYAIYLTQHDNLYRVIANPDLKRPIYVGKAVPVGWRTARTNELSSSLELNQRLREHARSISQAQNLELGDFRCRFVILEDVEVDLVVPLEAELIRHTRPLWNTVIDGFGNHDPGSGRYAQALSGWDVLHPGRTWAAKLMGAKPDIEVLSAKIKAFSDRLEPE